MHFTKSNVLLWVLGGIAITGVAQAAPAPLDPAFVEYLEQFADQKGTVFDAADLEEAGTIAQPSNKKPELAKPADTDRNRSKEISK